MVEFHKWSADSRWNDAALKYQFRQGLSETFRDELARIEAPTSLENLIQVSIQLDRRLLERWFRTHPDLPTHMANAKGRDG